MQSSRYQAEGFVEFFCKHPQEKTRNARSKRVN